MLSTQRELSTGWLRFRDERPSSPDLDRFEKERKSRP